MDHTGTEVGSAFGPVGTAMGFAADLGMQAFSNAAAQKKKNAQYDAINSYLDKLDKGRADTQNTFKDYYNTGDQQFNQEANTQVPELQKMQQDMNNQSTDAQQNMNSQMQAQLAQQGVRGGQAATQLGRATGDLNRQLGYNQNSLAFNDAENRQNARMNYDSQKAMNPYKTLTSAQWLYQPSSTEMNMMQNAINTKFS